MSDPTGEQVQHKVLSLVLQMVQGGCSGGWLTDRLPYFNLEAQGLACAIGNAVGDREDAARGDKPELD